MDDLDRELAAIEGEGSSRPSVLSSSGSKVLPIAVAAIALIGFGAITFYAYNQGVRSGSEEAAPLLSPEGSAKVQPEDPGGMEIPHQDKLVYNRVEDSVDDTRVERLLPPPDEPTPPKLEDVTVESEGQAVAQVEVNPVPGEGQAEENTIEQSVTRKGSDGQPRPPEPKSPEAPSLPEPTLAEPETPPTAAPEPEPTPEAEPVQTVKAEPKDLSKAWRIQISAVKSMESANEEWKRQASKYPDLLGKLSLEVQKIEVQGKGTFYRVRGGPLTDQDAARKLCDDLKKKKVSCIVVKPGA